MKKTLYIFLLSSNGLSWENVWLICLEFLFLNLISSDDLGVETGIQEVKPNIWELLVLHVTWWTHSLYHEFWLVLSDSYATRTYIYILAFTCVDYKMLSSYVLWSLWIYLFTNKQASKQKVWFPVPVL